MKLSLVVMTAGKSQGQIIPITLPQFIIGRDPVCNLRPASAVISKRHCALLIKDGKLFVRDFESTNGTFLNDKQIKGEVPAKNGDILKIGPLEFKIVLETRSPGAKLTPPPPKPAAPGDDESVAAMLLSLQEEGVSGEEASTSADDSGVPAGSTVMDVIKLPPPEQKGEPAPAQAAPAQAAPTQAAPTQAAPAKKEEKKAEPKKGDAAHLAAKAILEKYTRRQR